MSAFTTHLSLGQTAYGVEACSYRPNYRVVPLTVGQIRVTETAPKARTYDDSDPLFKEEYMCIETGVGSGRIWQYGKNIFSTEADAQFGVVAHEQRAHKQRAEHDAREAEARKHREAQERAELQRLSEKYGNGIAATGAQQ
jgi:hypothetical protein